jgi:hypothetical protein
MGNKGWVHHYHLQFKSQSLEYHHRTSPRNKKSETQPSTGKCIPLANAHSQFSGTKEASLSKEYVVKGTRINERERERRTRHQPARAREGGGARRAFSSGHAHTHVRAHARTNAPARAHTRTRMHTHTHTHTRTRTHTHISYTIPYWTLEVTNLYTAYPSQLN